MVVKCEDVHTIKIGVIFSDTYTLHSVTPLIHAAGNDINLYFEEKGFKYHFEFLIENAEGSPNTHMSKVESFKSVGVDLIIGGGYSSQAEVSLPFMNVNDMLLISPSSTAFRLEIAEDNLFRLCQVDTAQAPVIAEMLWSYGIEACVVLQLNDLGLNRLYDLFKEEYENRGGVILDRNTYYSEEEDYIYLLQDISTTANEAVSEYGIDHVGVLILDWSEVVTVIIDHATDYPILNNLIWFGSEGTSQSPMILDAVPEEATKLKIYSPLAQASNNLTFYDAAYHDACWLYALSVVDANSADAMEVKASLPLVASEYVGVTGLCSLNEYGDRSAVNYDIWGYGKENGDVVSVKYGFYDSVLGDVIWGPEPTGINELPVANANGPYSGGISDAFSFSSVGSHDPDGRIVDFRWRFGDRSGYAYSPTPIHFYSEPGIFTVTLMVTDDDGAVSRDIAICTVFPPPNKAPIADAGGPYSGYAGGSISFNSSDSYDSDGTIVEYEWDFGDGASSDEEHPVHTYSQPGTYSISLRVTDDQGAIKTDATLCTVSQTPNEPPIADIGGPYSGHMRGSIYFSSSGSQDPDGTIVEYEWDFGDGVTSSKKNPVYVYSRAGNYTVTLKVTDDDGTTSTETTSCLVVQATMIDRISGIFGDLIRLHLTFETIAVMITIGGAVIGTMGWMTRTRREQRRRKIMFNEFIQGIDDVYTRYKMNARQCEAELYKLKDQIIETFSKGIIDETNYKFLDKRIEEYIEEIRKELDNKRLENLQDKLRNELQRMKDTDEVNEQSFQRLERLIEAETGLIDVERIELKNLIEKWRREFLKE